MSTTALHSTLNISETVTDRLQAWFQITTNRKWHGVLWSRDPKGAIAPRPILAARLFVVARLLNRVAARESDRHTEIYTVSQKTGHAYYYSFIHSYSFIFSCQNATKHELGDAINTVQ